MPGATVMLDIPQPGFVTLFQNMGHEETAISCVALFHAQITPHAERVEGDGCSRHGLWPPVVWLRSLLDDWFTLSQQSWTMLLKV